jgi:hypothetical protein
VDPGLTLGWALFPHFLVRTTGFPFELVEGLGLTDAAERVRALAAFESRITLLRETLWADHFPAAVCLLKQSGAEEALLRSLLRLRKRVAKRKECQNQDVSAVEPKCPDLAQQLRAWNDLSAARDARLARFVECFARDLECARAALRAISVDPDFQHAVFLLSPAMFQGTLRRHSAARAEQGRGARTRLAEKKLVAYLQRLCGKNERGSFFGPINFGEFVPDAPFDLEFTAPDRLAPRRNEVFMSHWGMEALAERIAREPSVEPQLRPRRSPLARIASRGGARVHSLDPSVPISETEWEIYRLCDGSRTLAAIAELLAKSLEDVLRSARALEQWRLIALAPEIPPTVPCALQFLRSRVEDLPPEVEARGRWKASLDELDGLRRAFKSGNLQARIEALERTEALFERLSGGVRAQRGSGEFYSDRLLLYEECSDALGPFRIGGRLHAAIVRQMQPALDLWAAAGCARWRLHQEVGIELFEKLSPSGAPVPYHHFQRELARLQREGGLGDRLARLDQEIRGRLSARLVRDPANHRAELPLDAVGSIRPLADTGRHSLICSPDLFLAAASIEDLRAGRFKVIAGDVHDDWTTLGAGACSFFHERRSEMLALQEEMLLGLPDGDRIATILPRRRHKDYCAEPPGVTVELSGRSVKPPDQVLPFSELCVAKHDGALMLLDRKRGRWLRLCTGDVRNLAHWIFSWPRVVSIPLGLGSHLPRVELNGVVLQRETWVLGCEDLAPLRLARGPDLMEAAFRFQESQGMPQFVFALSDREPKPFLVDFSNFFLLELLQEMLSRASRITFSEMLPGPSELWLRDGRGRYCAELRMGFTSVDAVGGA